MPSIINHGSVEELAAQLRTRGDIQNDEGVFSISDDDIPVDPEEDEVELEDVGESEDENEWEAEWSRFEARNRSLLEALDLADQQDQESGDEPEPMITLRPPRLIPVSAKRRAKKPDNEGGFALKLYAHWNSYCARNSFPSPGTGDRTKRPQEAKSVEHLVNGTVLRLFRRHRKRRRASKTAASA